MDAAHAYIWKQSILLARPVEPDGVHSILICDYHRLCGLCRRGCPNGGVHLRGFPFKRCHQLSYKLRVLLCSILLWETEGRQEWNKERSETQLTASNHNKVTIS